MLRRKVPFLLAGCLVLSLALSSCSIPALGGGTPSPSPSASLPADTPAPSSTPELETETVTGTFYLVDTELDYMVLASGDSYFQFNLNGVDVSHVAPGDRVVVTYTGTLDADSEKITADLVSVERAS